MDHRKLLDFWFGERARRAWFAVDRAFDEELRREFGPMVEAALAGSLTDWEATPDGSLALVLLLDQLPRNIYRDSRRAFDGDAAARRVADQSLARGFDGRVPPDRRLFFYLPFEHAEDAAAQAEALRLFARLGADHPALADLEGWAKKHADIVVRFGRFPHRNAVLGRESTAEEIEFLSQPGSSF